MIIVVKIGTAVLAHTNGQINREVLVDLISDVSGLKKQTEGGHQIVIVTSGAVGVGRSVVSEELLATVKPSTDVNRKIFQEQILAAIGQPKLMSFYIDGFQKHGIDCAQILTTRSDFADRKFYLSLRTVVEGLLRLGVIPIFNENDVLSPEELDFSDNDQLAVVVAAMVKADKLIILTDVEGVYDRPLDEAGTKIVEQISNADEFLKTLRPGSGSSVGKGGIQSKLLAADLVTSLGISMHIASGKTSAPISRLIAGERIGTYFPTSGNKPKPDKLWLATAAVSTGKIVVSNYLADILREQQRAVSVLFPGIEEVQGEFNAKDVVEVCDVDGTVLGRGVCRHSSDDLKEKIEHYKALPEEEKERVIAAHIVAVHYDYFVHA